MCCPGPLPRTGLLMAYEFIRKFVLKYYAACYKNLYRIKKKANEKEWKVKRGIC